MIKRLELSASAALFCLCFGCAGELEPEARPEGTAPEAIEEVEQPLYSETRRSMWPTSAIPVCWATSTFNDASYAAFRQQARDAVENSYGRVSNLRFTGWAACPSNPNGRIRMLLGPGFGQTTIGYAGAGGVTELSSAPAMDVFMHEFSHALGFDHEFDRPDRSNPCFPTGVNITPANARTYTPYDNDSITNGTYCHNNITLSPWDVVGMQRVYGRKPVGSLVGANNKCADVDNPGGGQPTGATRLQAWECIGNANQSWSYSVLHRFRASSFTWGFMDVQWANTANGTPIWNWQDNFGPAQTWEMDDVQVVGMGDLCLEVPNNSWFNGQTLQLATCDVNAAAQKWSIKHSGTMLSIGGAGNNGGFCLAINGHSQAATLSSCDTPAVNALGLTQRHIFSENACLDVQWGNPVPGTPVWGWQCNWNSNAEAQHWKIRGPIHGLAGKCLDLDIGGGAVNGANLQLWDCNGWANQSWEYHF